MAKEKINKKEFYEEIERLYMLYGKANKNTFYMYSIYKDYNFNWYCRRFGGIKNILKDIGLEFNGCVRTNKSDIQNKAKNLFKEYGYINKDLCTENGINSTVVRKYFENYNNLFKLIGAKINMYKDITREDILSDTMRIYNEFKTTSSNIYRKYGKYSQSTIERLFGRWENLIDELGLVAKSNSSYETLIESILKANKISFKKHHNFSFLKSPDGYNMYVDFYIPSINTIIEYDGEQHYKFVKYFHKTKENFKKYQERDKLKEKLLKEHGFSVEHIIFNEDIVERMNSILNLI